MTNTLKVKGNTLYMYAPIGREYKDGFSDLDFINAAETILEQHDELVLRINSHGGEVYAGFAICNFLRDVTQPITVHIDGVAASMASIIALSGDKVYMAENALLMIHNPHSGARGDSDAMRKQADLLDKLRVIALDTYYKRTNIPKNALAQLMKDETWYTAEEAVQAGFVDKVVRGQMQVLSKSVLMMSDGLLKIYNNKNVSEMNEQTLELLGLPADATVDDVNAAIQTLIEERDAMQKQTEEEEEMRIDNILNMSVKNGHIKLSQKSIYRNLFKKDFDSTLQLLDQTTNEPTTLAQALANAKTGGGKSAKVKMKSEWTLDDYRRNAPHELEQSPALVARLSANYKG